MCVWSLHATKQAYWAAIKKINDKKKAEAAAEKKRRKALTKEQRAAEDLARKAEEVRKAAEDEEMVLRKETVIMRGNGVDQNTIVKVCVGFWRSLLGIMSRWVWGFGNPY